MPVNNLVDVACVLSPDLHYELLSKQGLANSGLRTPDCEVVEFDTMAPAVASCYARMQDSRAFRADRRYLQWGSQSMA